MIKLRHLFSFLLLFTSCYNYLVDANYGQKKLVKLIDNKDCGFFSEPEIKKVIASRTLFFYIKEPDFIRTTGTESSGGFSIKAIARLYDYPVIRASIQREFNLTENDNAYYNQYEEQYNIKHDLDKYVRIEIILLSPDIESYVKSAYWDIYLIDGLNNRIALEKIEDEENIKSTQKTIRTYVQKLNIFKQNVYSNCFNIYVKKKDFYGLKLLDKQRRFLSLVFSHDQKTKGRCCWYFKQEQKL